MNNQYVKTAVENYIENGNEHLIIYPYNSLYEILGYEGIENLCYQMSGTTLYIPSLQHLFKDAIREKIQKDFDGTNYKELATNYGLSERTVRNYIK